MSVRCETFSQPIRKDQAMWQTVTSDKSAVAQSFSNFQTFTPTYSYTCGRTIKTVVN